MNYALFTDIGKNRTKNEDSLLILNNDEQIVINQTEYFTKTGIVKGDIVSVVANGMGGIEYGEIASKIVCEAFRDTFSLLVKDVLLSKGEDQIREAIHQAHQLAQVNIKQQLHNFQSSKDNESNEKKMEMGSTVAGFYYRAEEDIIIFHAGDSRLYLCIDNTRVIPLTKDHNFFNSDKPKIALMMIFGKLLTNCIGGGIENSFVEIGKFPNYYIKPGNKLFLCTDGVFDFIDDKELSDIIISSTVNTLYENLRRIIYSANAPDNFSGIFIEL